MGSEVVTTIRGIGPTQARRLERLAIRTKLDLILHLPFRYQDRTKLSPLRDIEVGSDYLVQGEIVDVEVVESAHRNNRSLFVTIADDSGTLNLRLLHYSSRQYRQFAQGSWLRLFGPVRFGARGLEMVHPEYRLFFNDPGPPDPELKPVYHTTSGISSARLGSWIQQALSETAFLPKFAYLDQFLGDAIRNIHNPDIKGGFEAIELARQRVVVDELLAFVLLQRRRKVQQKSFKTRAMKESPRLGQALIDSLHFTLTGSQESVINEVISDLSQTRPTLRLIQGDVGSGKTVVAVYAAAHAAQHGFQTAFMAPTELLAEQHHATLSQWLGPLGIDVTLLAGRIPVAVRREREKAIASGESLVAVGTHALFQRRTSFDRLGLAIIDEQHRFGVHQRMQLRDKGILPHQLVMTATPIPRTLAQYLYADMDISAITELPPGRIPVATSVHPPRKREDVIQAVRRKVEAGFQAFWVCVSIEESEQFDFKPVDHVIVELREKLSGIKVDYVHGRMAPDEKTARMQAFRQGEIQVLVATTVIEVGIDVPNATLVVIDNAERLGLAQLHQLRGRVGRGAAASHCMLNYNTPLSKQARLRLHAVRDSNDGFYLAQKDLELRGAGEVFGMRQSGDDNFRVADLRRDIDLLKVASDLSRQLIADDNELASEIINTWSPPESDYASV